MKVAIGCDHAGYALMEPVRAWLADSGFDVTDFGTFSAESVDYPDYAEKVCSAVRAGECRFGILICATGIGVGIAANKVRGIRAATVCSADGARLSRAHNDANVICLPGRFMEPELAVELVRIWLNTPFDGGRHQRRVDKIAALERRE